MGNGSILLPWYYPSIQAIQNTQDNLAEDSANRTHQRPQQPPNGFEDRPGHQSRLPSGLIVAGTPRPTLNWVYRFAIIPRSSNGRTAAFGAVNRGSNPCRGAKQIDLWNVVLTAHASFTFEPACKMKPQDDWLSGITSPGIGR